ncbi:MAG: hypothetical protein OHK0023_26760 [Anaerolineae bacterium]
MDTLILGIILTVAGAVICFSGWRFFDLAVKIAGLISGAALGYALAVALNATDIVQIVLAVVGALIGFLLAVVLWRLGVYLGGAFAGALIGFGIASSFLLVSGGALIAIVVAGAIIGFLLAVVLRKPIIVLSTAISGALVLVAGIGTLIPNLGLFNFSALQNLENPQAALGTLGIIVWAIVAVLGMASQWASSGGGRRVS